MPPNDGTADIIREYADRYPDLIFPILQTENQYSKGLTNVSGTFNFPRARGKYIAMCEGDDYWTDDRKLQKQVDYLEANPGCSLCFHSAKVEIQGKALTEHAMRPYKGSRMVSPEEIIDKTSGYPTASLMFYREMVADLPDFITMPPSRIFRCSSFPRTGAGPGIWMSPCVYTGLGARLPGLRL